MDINDLLKPAAYQRRNRRVFRTYSSLRYHLDRRHENASVETGAVVESPLGLLINPERFDLWLLGRTNRTAA